MILTGDFNAGPGNEAIGPIRDSLGLVDTWEKMHHDSLPAGTFHAFSGEETGERIDSSSSPRTSPFSARRYYMTQNAAAGRLIIFQ